MRIPADIDTMTRTIARNWEAQQKVVESSSARLATGSRIVGAVDDAAGVAVAERVRAQFESLYQAGRNAQEGVNLVQIAQGSLQQTMDFVQRIRVMALQSANGTFSDDQRGFLQRGVLLTLDEIDAIARRTKVGEVSLLDGSRSSLHIQTGPDARDGFEVGLRAADTDGVGLTGVSVATQDEAVSALDVLDEAIAVLNEHRAQMAAEQRRMERMVETLGASADLQRGQHARISDADLGAETVRLLRAQISADAGVAMMSQVRQAAALVLQMLLPSATPASGSAGSDGSTGASAAAVGRVGGTMSDPAPAVAGEASATGVPGAGPRSSLTRPADDSLAAFPS